MPYAGIDVGAQSIKAVILEGNKILSHAILITEEDGSVASTQALEEALDRAALKMADLKFIVSTGVGRSEVPAAGKQRSEQMCHGRGARFLFPSARTVLDVGAEGCKAVKLSERGDIVDFANNSKCAAGTGAFLEAMARILEVSLEEMGELAVKAKDKVKISNFCAVFAESEVISQVHKGYPRDQILAGIHYSMADRISDLMGRVGLIDDVVMTGGGAKNIGLVKALEEIIKKKILIPPEPIIVGALGAALIAASV